VLNENKCELQQALAFTWASVRVKFHLNRYYYFQLLLISRRHNWKKSGEGVALPRSNADSLRVILMAVSPPPDLAQRFPVAALREEFNVLIPYCMNVLFGIYGC
jgi:hypothetical protein